MLFMKIVLIVTTVLILLTAAILLYRDYYVKLRMEKDATLKYKAIQPIIRDLAAGKTLNQKKVMALAKSPSLRYAVFKVLEAYDKRDLFPAEYFTCEKGAESFLVTWLEFPTELGVTPDEIELLTMVSVDEGASDYFVFKYITRAAHWIADGWMIGVCGPYGRESMPFDIPTRVFSRFKRLDSVTPESEVQWVHKHIRQKYI